MSSETLSRLEYGGDGKRYKVVAPDTLDLADRARIALNGLGGTIDPDCHHTMFFNIHYCSRPPFMRHQGSADVTCDPKFAESFPMMRLMCGSDLYEDIEAGHRAELLSRLSPEDGLYYNIAHPDRPWRGSYNPAFDGGRTDEDLSNVGGCGRMLRAMATWRELIGPDAALDGRIHALVRGLSRIAVCREDYAFYPNGGVGEPFSYPRSGWLRTEEPCSEVEGGEGSVLGYQGHQIQGLMRWYALSGDSEALDLAGRLTRFCVLPKFWGGVVDLEGDASGLVGHVAAGKADPPGLAGCEQGHWYTHFHARAIALRGILEYARVVQDARLLEFVRRSYEFTLSMGIPRMGWVNCWPGRHATVEGCALGDLVALGIRLSDSGVGDYWDDVDAVVRNHLIEQQLVRGELLEEISAASEPRDPEQQSAYPKQESTEKVIARSLGNFAGMSTPADICQPWVMQCCTGNGTQGLYYAWEGIVRCDADTAQVNLLLNRASPWLDVDSHLPYEGKVALRIKRAQRVAVRIPFWVNRRKLTSTVNEASREGARIGNYLTFSDLQPGDRIVLEFPVPESRATQTVAAQIPGQEKAYAVSFRGSTVVDVSPHEASPTTYPLYLRDHMRGNEAPMKEVTRFVPARTLLAW